MKNVYTSLKKLAVAAAILFLVETAVAQPTKVFILSNGIFYPNNTLSDFGSFRQYKFLAPASSSNNQWHFRDDAAARWGNPACVNLGIPGYDQVVVPPNPITYGFAQHWTNPPQVGCYHFMPVVINGYYYTFNVTEKSTPSSGVDEDMAVLETSYNPVSITSVSNPPASPLSIDTVAITVNTSASLSSGEYLYLRYSTSSSFATSNVLPVAMSGTSGTAKIPPQAAGATIYYYAFSSNRSASQLSSQVGTYGEGAYNMLTLNIDNNSLSNYSYSVAPCATAPTSIASSVPGCLKVGNSTTLTLSGGSLPSGGNFVWYKDGCGVGTSLGTGTSITVSPTSTTNYFVRAEDLCGNTSCASINILVGDSSVAPTSISSVDSVCQNVLFKLKQIGGTLGTGATWQWYRVGCGGSAIPWVGTGDSIFTQMNPGVSNYYVKAIGTCNTTSCMMKAVVIRDSSISPISPPSSTICLGTSKTFSVSGGKLGHGANWKWYSGTCGGTLLGTGPSLTVSPAATGTYTYYARVEGTCNTTTCATYTLIVADSSITPTSVSGPTAVCERSAPLVFKPVGGLLSSGASWTWTRVACHGNPNQVGLGSGDSLVLTTATLGVGTHTVFVRGLNGCNMTSCVSKTFVIRDTSVPANNITGTNTICRGQSSTLSVNGGKLGAGASWKWYLGNCGGTSIATGSSFTASPTLAGSYTYFARAEGTCNNTICRTFTLTVRDTSTSPTSVSASATTICLGQTINLNVNGGNLGHAASWKWYTGSCGGTAIGTGSTITWGPPSAGSVTVFGRAEGSCNNTLCRSVTITVRDTSVPATAIIGINTICQNVTFKLKRSGGSLGFGATWQWYRTACGGPGIPWVGTGDSIFTQMDPGTSTYYLKAIGFCNSTICAVKSVVIRDSSVRPTEAPTATICLGSSMTFGINGGNPGGSLGHGAQWKWYSGSCGGTLVGTGSTLTVSPSAVGTYYYYRRAEGTCNTTTCATYTLTVTDSSKTPLSISGPSAVCQRNTPMVFKPVGGKLSPGASWTWSRVACHGSPGQVGLGSGDSLVLTTAMLGIGTHTIFVRGLNGCNTTSCVSRTIVISDTSLPASGISGTTTICVGENSTLTLNGGKLGAGATWKWYLGNCGGTSIATGNSCIVSPSAPGTYIYYARAEGPCNNTICRLFTLTVRDTSYPVVGILGNTTICQGTSTTLSINGGSLAPGASWKWYSGSCGGTFVGTGTSVSVAPASNTTYFVRAEGTCKNSPCKSVVVNVRDTSRSATSITGTTVVCQGSSTTLSVIGGTLGSGAIWRWYSGNCAGTPVGNGTSIVLSPTGNTTYFVRAESSCNTTNCVSVNVTVRQTSTPASSIVTFANNICKGQSTTMYLTGGTLGHNAVWRWYEGSCGGTSVGSGTSITVAPSAGLKTYFVRAEGTCNNTTCVSQTINVRDTSEPAASINATLTVLCAGSTTVLTPNGGHLGTSANWKWYLGSCGSGLVSTGSTLTVTPTVGGDYTYFLRAEGSCNTTKCASITIRVRDVSRPGTISGSGAICLGSTNTLTVNGGALGTGASWNWYTGTCGGTLQGTGSTLSVRPTSPGTYTYFVRAEGICNTTPCASFTFTVSDTNKPALAITGPSAVCPGNTPFTLKRVGGTLTSSGARWDWYRGACGGSGVPWVGTGDSITLRPSQLSVGNHVFYLKANGGCNVTACVTFVLTIRQAPTAPSSIVGSTNICRGQSTTLSVGGGVQGTNATWTWYRGTCGGTPVGTGSSVTVSPNDTTTYFVRSEGPCGITGCASVRVDVIQTPVAPVAINANYNQACAGTPIKLYANGPALLKGETRQWYINNGGTLTSIGTGDSIIVTLSNTTDVELRTENRCFNSTSVTKQINILNSPVGTWVGVKNNSWHESDNWCGGIPTATTDVVIPSGTPNQPVITAIAKARNLTVNSGANLSVSTGGTLQMNGSLVKSGIFTSSGTVSFLSGGAVTADGFITRNLEVNLAGEVTLNGSITVTGNLLLGKGSVITGTYEVNVTNDNSNAVVAVGGNNNFRSGWIAGNLRRSIKTVDETYQFPVGSIAEGNNAEFVNHNLAGVSSVLAHFRPKPGTDAGLNVFETATSNPYGSVSNGGVWYLEPTGSITSGNFDLKLWFHNQPTFTAGLVDNSFSILNRPASSTQASDWVKPATNSTYIAGIVSLGYVRRIGINAMGQFGIGLTLYPVKVKGTTYSGNVTIQPNPFNAEFAVKMNIPRTAQVSVNVYDQAGRLVAEQNAGKLSGNNTLKVDMGNLSEGTYTVVVKGDGQTIHTEKMVKILK